MVKMITLDGAYAPVVICDVCRERIVHFSEGYVVWNPDTLEFRHIHQGRCDEPPGERKYEYSCPLAEHMIYLNNNTGLWLKEYQDEIRKLGRSPL